MSYRNTVGISCLQEQFEMNIKSFETDVPYCLFNIAPIGCGSRLDEKTINMFKSRQDRILAKELHWGRPISFSVDHFYCWDGVSLDGWQTFALFKSVSDSQTFLKRDFARICAQSRKELKDNIAMVTTDCNEYECSNEYTMFMISNHLMNLDGFFTAVSNMGEKYNDNKVLLMKIYTETIDLQALIKKFLELKADVELQKELTIEIYQKMVETFMKTMGTDFNDVSRRQYSLRKKGNVLAYFKSYCKWENFDYTKKFLPVWESLAKEFPDRVFIIDEKSKVDKYIEYTPSMCVFNGGKEISIVSGTSCEDFCTEENLRQLLKG